MLYIANFLHVTDQQEILETERRHGEFSLIIEAETPHIVVQMFKDRIMELRSDSDFFQGECRIFFIQLLEFLSFPKTSAMMLNYKSIVGDPFLPFIGCVIPTAETDACRIFDWQANPLEIDGQGEQLFIEFKDA